METINCSVKPYIAEDDFDDEESDSSGNVLMCASTAGKGRSGSGPGMGGKGGKGYGKVGAKRHCKKKLKETICGVTGNAIQRLMRRGGVKWSSKLIDNELRGETSEFLKECL